jgi:integrase
MLYRRPNSKNWYVRFEIGGKEIRRSAGTDDKKAAAEFENRLRGIAWREIKLGEKRRTFDEAALRWLEERDDKRALHSDESIIKWFREHLEGRLLTDIDGDVIAGLRQKKRREASKSTVNRHMAWLRSMLKAARDEWGWIESHPKVPMFPEPKGEPHWITRKQFLALHAALPTHLARCAMFAVSTGLRSGPIRALKWDQVDMRKRVLLVKISQAKNAKALRVPLGKSAMTVLRECRKQRGEYIFTKDGKQVPREMVNRAWRRACKVAKVGGFRFHDCRHTWASWHVQNGTPLHVLQALGGWSSIEQVQRYAHLAPSDLDRWARNLG